MYRNLAGNKKFIHNWRVLKMSLFTLNFFLRNTTKGPPPRYLPQGPHHPRSTPVHTIWHTKRCRKNVSPSYMHIFFSEYHTINSITINNGTLRLINFLNSSQWSSLSKALLASKNVTNTVVDLFLYNSIYSLKIYNSVPCPFLNLNWFALVLKYS